MRIKRKLYKLIGRIMGRCLRLKKEQIRLIEILLLISNLCYMRILEIVERKRDMGFL